MERTMPASYNRLVGVGLSCDVQWKELKTMVSGHLQVKKGFYYVVLSYYNNNGKRRVKYFSTGLPEKGNKRKAEACFLQTAYRWNKFRNGWDTAIFPPPLTSMPTLTTLQNCRRQRQWSAEWHFPNRWISAASGAKSQTMAERTDFNGSNTPKCPKSPCSFQKTGCSFHSFGPILSKRAKKKSPKNLDFSGFFGGELGIRTLGTFLYTAFRVLHLRPLGQLSVYVFCFPFRTGQQNNFIIFGIYSV